MKYTLIETNTYIKEKNKLNSKQLEKLSYVIEKLRNKESLEAKYKDHKLKGNLTNLRNCHIEPDLVLIYEKDKKELILTALRINSHANLGLK